MGIWEELEKYRKSEIVVYKEFFATYVCPDALTFNFNGEIVGALANDNRTFFYLRHRTTPDGRSVIPQFKEPIVPHSLDFDGEGNPLFGMTKDNRIIALDGVTIATSEKGDKIFVKPDLRTQDYVAYQGRLWSKLPLPVYAWNIREIKDSMRFNALANDNQTVFILEQKFHYEIPEEDLEKLLQR